MTEKAILRAQFDGRKSMWKIVKKTFNGCGGWARFGSNWYFGKEETISKINRIVSDFPDQYEKDAI